MLTQERLKELLHYDETTGFFTRRVDVGTRGKAGGVAGCVRNDGYIHLKVDGRLCLAHRLVWLYVHGEFPPADIDHANRIRADNRISNLRLATRAENNTNSKTHSTNTSGFRGVSWNKGEGKWRAYAGLNRKQHHLGYYPTAEAAHEAYDAFARQNYGKFYLPR